MVQTAVEYFPKQFVHDCSLLVGERMNLRLETQLVPSLVSSFSDGRRRDRFITFLWLVMYFVPVMYRNFRNATAAHWIVRSEDEFCGMLVSDGFVIPTLMGGHVPHEELKTSVKGMCLPEFLCKTGNATVWGICRDGWNLDVDTLPVMARSVLSVCSQCRVSPIDLIEKMDMHKELPERVSFHVSSELSAFYGKIKTAILNEAPCRFSCKKVSTKDRLQELGKLKDAGVITPEYYEAERASLGLVELF